jgi:hypothetical protein
MATYKNICAFLAKCRFNPRNPGPLSIIADTNNPNYYELRVIELIKEINLNGSFNNDPVWFEKYETNIIKAIQLLVLARETRFSSLLTITEKLKDYESKNYTKKEKA